MKTSELTGAALDWAVARIEFPEHLTQDLEIWATPLPCDDPDDFKYQPSTDWSQGGPIIEREKISAIWMQFSDEQYWVASMDNPEREAYGPAPLIAAMRCYVASKLGEEVDVPEELK